MRRSDDRRRGGARRSTRPMSRGRAMAPGGTGSDRTRSDMAEGGVGDAGSGRRAGRVVPTEARREGPTTRRRARVGTGSAKCQRRGGATARPDDAAWSKGRDSVARRRSLEAQPRDGVTRNGSPHRTESRRRQDLRRPAERRVEARSPADRRHRDAGPAARAWRRVARRSSGAAARRVKACSPAERRVVACGPASGGTAAWRRAPAARLGEGVRLGFP